METRIGRLVAPAMGDVRAMGVGDTIWITPEAPLRADWSRYADALTVALLRGADIRWAR
jgi:hypothetical protein